MAISQISQSVVTSLEELQPAEANAAQVADFDHAMSNGADSLGGRVDIHYRLPVTVSREDTWRWLDPALMPEQALHLARTCLLDAELFEWHAVDNPLVPSAKPRAAPPAAAQTAFDWGAD